MRLVQFDFPYPGPFGEAMSAAMADLARDIAGEPGLLWKIWTENPETGEAGGIYLFADAASADAYIARHSARLQAFGVSGIRARSFAVNEALSRIDRAPL